MLVPIETHCQLVHLCSFMLYISFISVAASPRNERKADLTAELRWARRSRSCPAAAAAAFGEQFKVQHLRLLLCFRFLKVFGRDSVSITVQMTSVSSLAHSLAPGYFFVWTGVTWKADWEQGNIIRMSRRVRACQKGRLLMFVVAMHVFYTCVCLWECVYSGCTISRDHLWGVLSWTCK